MVASIAISLFAGSITNAQDLGPFAAFDSIPAEIDAAAVFENPAENLLLSPVGRTLRTLLSMGGVFSQTERAWQALGKAFDAPVDDTIRSLLSKRVVVVWDGFERGERDIQGLTNSIDTRWALVCEVEPEYLRTIRSAMRPVKRDIVHGRAVYAIEQGRYRVVMLESSGPDDAARVLLAPSNGSELLHNVLAHFVQNPQAVNPDGSMVSGHQDMLTELNLEHANKHAGSPTFALLARTSTLINTLLPGNDSAKMNEQAGDPAFAAMVDLNQQSLRCTFASDLQINPTLQDAPVALLDAVGQDAIFTLAASRALRVRISENSLSIGMGLQGMGMLTQALPGEEKGNEDIFDAPMLMTISPLLHERDVASEDRMGVCLLIENPSRENGRTAMLADETIGQAIGAFDPKQSPQFKGRFPAIPRSISLRSDLGDQEEQLAAEPGWLEHNPQVAWLTDPRPSSDLIIGSIGPQGTDPSAHIIKMQQAVRSLEALGAPQPSGVLLRARIQPSRTLELFGESTIMDFVLAKLVREFNIDVRRGLRSGIRGSLEVELSSPNAKPGLGTK